MKFISPANDYFFRYLFGNTGHESITLDFINAVLSDVDMGPLTSIEIKNPFNIKESVADKQSILDIKAEDETHRLYNIEMQLQGNPLFTHRSLYYWARCYTGQLNEGDDYRRLSPVICINVVDFPIFDHMQWVHTCFLLTEHKATHVVLTDHLNLHFLHLTAFQNARYTVSEPLSQWLQYFCLREDNMKGLETLLESNPAIARAHRLYEKFTADEQLMAQYEARQKYLRDLATIKGVSFDEGKQLGLSEGIEKGKQLGGDEKDRLTVHTMHQKGLDAATIADYTSLSIEKVKSILKEPPPDK